MGIATVKQSDLLVRQTIKINLFYFFFVQLSPLPVLASYWLRVFVSQASCLHFRFHTFSIRMLAEIENKAALLAWSAVAGESASYIAVGTKVSGEKADEGHIWSVTTVATVRCYRPQRKSP